MTDTLANNAPAGIFSFEDDGTLVDINQTACVLLRYDRQALLSSSVETIFTLPTRIFFQTHLFPLVRMHQHAEEIFVTLLSKDGEYLPVLLSAKRVEAGGLATTICAFIVVRNRKKFEDELVAAKNLAQRTLRENSDLTAAKAELENHTEKLEEQMRLVSTQHHELTQFNHAITHNLREPLRKILMYIDRERTDQPLPQLAKLAKAAEQMKTVVTGLQQYVWLNEKINEFSNVNLTDVLQEAIVQLSQEADPASFVVHHDDLPSLEGDREQLRLLLYHVLLNAVKFKKNGKATILLRSTVLKQNVFRNVKHRYVYEDYVRVEIMDDGIGFDPAYREYVFELFKRMRAGDGQGLGLALCKKIADNHGGHIEADSEPDKQTKITVWLPLKR